MRKICVSLAVTLFSAAAAIGGCGGSMDKPAAPSTLTAEMLTGGVHLTWKDNSSDETQFMVNRKQMGVDTDFKTIATPTFNTTAYHDATVMSGKTYTYNVQAMKNDMMSDPSNEATITMP